MKKEECAQNIAPGGSSLPSDMFTDDSHLTDGAPKKLLIEGPLPQGNRTQQGTRQYQATSPGYVTGGCPLQICTSKVRRSHQIG